MAERHQQTTTRLDFRLDRKLKALIEEAADLCGQNVSDFAVSVLVEHSRKVLREHSVTVLSGRDRELFLQMLDSEEEPNAALKKAARRHTRRVNDTSRSAI